MWTWLMLGMVLALTGCSQAVTSLGPEEDDAEFRRGRQFLRQDRKREALESFLSVIERRPGDAAESHFEAAELFLTHLNDPISAIYHYQRYRERRRDGDKVRRVDQRIETAKKEFARTLPGNPLRSDVERLDLIARLEVLQAENHSLKREVAELRESLARAGVTPPPAPVTSGGGAMSRSAPSPTTAPAPVQAAPTRPVAPAPTQTAPAPAPARVTTYVVQPGDTLYRISIAVYGTPARWNEIYAANRDRIPNQNSLRVGTELRIP